MKPDSRSLLIIAVVLVGLLLLIAGYFISAQTPIQLRAENCDIAKRDCSVADEEVEVTASLSPRPVPVLEEVRIEVTGKELSGETLHLLITGIELDMGLIETELQRDESGVYRGRFYLSVCSRKVMTWKMVLSGSSKGRPVEAIFHFQTHAQRPVEILG